MGRTVVPGDDGLSERESLHSFVWEPPSGDLDLPGAETFPERSQRLLLAAPLDHSGPEWAWFVAMNELESWGRPGCIVADSMLEVPARGLNAWTMWSTYLACDPPVQTGTYMSALADAPRLPLAGPWVVVPHEDPVAAIAWARENVAEAAEPPGPDREPLLSELVSPPLTIGVDVGARGSQPSFGWEVDTYTDLLARRDEVAAWLEQARSQLVEPFAAAFGERLSTSPLSGDGPAYGAVVWLNLESVKGRGSSLPSTADGWAKALARLRKGELRSLGCTMIRCDGTGMPSPLKRGMAVSVEAGDPARFVVRAAKPLLDGHREAWLAVILRLMRDAAVTFDAVYGYASADGNTAGDALQSPYERRHGIAWEGQRLDAHARGVHWGNLLGPKHLEAIGGRVALGPYVEAWGEDLWWVRLSEDPFGPDREQADQLAARLAPIMPRLREKPSSP